MLNRANLISVVHVALVALFLALVFPYSALNFSARPSEASKRPFATFAEFDAATLKKTLSAAKMSWQSEGFAVKSLHIDLSAKELPEAPVESVVTLQDRTLPPHLSSLKVEPIGYRPSLAAPPPERIPVEKEFDLPVFSRESMLSL